MKPSTDRTVEGNAVEGNAVEGNAVEGNAVEGNAVVADQGNAVEGNGIEGNGVEGNARLTAVTGVVLVLLLAVEGVTILRIGQLLTLHVFVGVLLVGPVLLKIASTGYRFVRYYTGSAPYVRRGPPHPALRAIGPLVVLSSVAVLASGIAVISAPQGQRGWLLTAHQASFIVWISVTTLHVLGHLVETVTQVGRELHGRSGRTVRLLAVALALAVGVALAVPLTPLASSWHGHHRHHRPAPVSR
jgi:hypothetical protein